MSYQIIFETKIVKMPDGIDSITENLDVKTLRDIIKLLIDRLTPVNIKMNRWINSK